VYALAWDDVASVLYVGGVFDSLNNSPFTIGIAQWRRNPGGYSNASASGAGPSPTPGGGDKGGGSDGGSGLEVFPGGGVSMAAAAEHSQIVALAFDRASEVYYSWNLCLRGPLE
jgi:hypothetical protein